MILQAILWLLPWSLRRKILCRVYGWKIAPTAKINRFSVIRAKHVKMDEHAWVGKYVYVNTIDKLEIQERGCLGKMSVVVGYPSSGRESFLHVENRKCELLLGRGAILVRHRIDCTAGVYIGDYTTVAGIGSQFFTHSIDIYKNRQDAKPIIVGKYCLLGSRCILLPGANLPDYCVLGAGSVLTKAYEETCCVYAGSPAKMMKKLKKEDVAYFNRSNCEVG